ncbi:MAG: hypothetical protein ACPGXK_01200 [Phycisphaerae bacterium]
MSTVSDTISIPCPSCSEKLKVPRAAIGRKGRCPKCQNVIVITEPEPVPPPVEDEADDDLFGGGLLDDLAKQESAAAADESSGLTKKACSNCGQKMPIDAVLCVSCGYDEAKGKVIQKRPAKAPKPERSGGLKSHAANVGSFGIGCALSFVGALVGAAIWAGVLIATEYEVAYIAIGLGFLSGLGMAIGYRGEGITPGITAAGIAILGIVIGKASVFVYYSSQVLQDEMDSIAAIGTVESEGLDEIASHASDVEQVLRGIPPFDYDAQEKIWEREYEHVSELDEDGLAERKAEIKSWKAGGKWDDAEFVKNYVIHRTTVAAFEAETPPNEVVPEDEPYDEAKYDERTRAMRSRWNKIRKVKWREAEQMTDDVRLSTAKELFAAVEVEEMVERLASHNTMLRRLAEAKGPGDESYSSTYDEEQAKLKAESPEVIREQAQALDAWENGEKWNDETYIRNRLVDMKAQSALEEAVPSPDYDLEDYERAYETYVKKQAEKWGAIHASAVAEVDGLSSDQRVTEIKNEEARLKEEMEERLAEFRDRVQQEYAKDVAGSFFDVAFDPIDLLFIGLAVFAAYRVGNGSLEDAFSND